MITDYEVAAWEIAGTEYELLVCSKCGFIASEIIEHLECDAILQDWWHLNLRCFRKKEQPPQAAEQKDG
jgi:hypothetical protein